MKRFILFAILLLVPQFAFAGMCGVWGISGTSPYSVTADSGGTASLALDDVKACATAVDTGDTILLPTGSVSWTGGVTVPSGKKITLMGAGKTSTVITRSSFGTCFNLGRTGSRVTGMGLVNGAINTEGYGFILDNLKVEKTGSWATVITIRSLNTNSPAVPYGLIHSCDIVNGRIDSSGTNMMSPDGDGTAQHDLWYAAHSFGTANSVYIEDCTFTDGHSIDGNYGGKYVFRFNTIIGGLGIEAHSARSNQRGIRTWETYHNALTKGSVYMYLWKRAGTGFIFGNTFSADVAFRFDLRRLFDPGSADYCDGFSGWDENAGAGDEAGYACRDQLGRGSDASLWHHNPTGAYDQPLTPAYLWLNREGASIKTVSRVNSSGYHIQPDRDYYEEVGSFTGASGVGVGTLANRPATCTTGVGYWATDQGSWNKTLGGDQGVLYKCTSTNTWSVYYTPYEYPHPMRGEEPAPDTTPPVISNVLPTGEQACSTDPRDVAVSCDTDKNASCRIGTVGAAWAQMSAMTTTGTLSHAHTLTSLACGGSYSRDILCRDSSENQSTAATVSFTIAASGTTCADAPEYCDTEDGGTECEANDWYWYDDACHSEAQATPVTFPTLGILDNFDRETLGAGWTNIVGEFVVSTNQLAGTSTTHNRALWNAASFTDAEAYMTIPTVGNAFQITLRGALDASRWVFVAYEPLSSPAHRISVGWRTASAITYIGDAVYQEFSAGDKFGAEVVGNTYRVYRKPAAGDWYELTEVVDSDPVAASGYIGAHAYGTTVRLDDFGGGEISPPLTCTDDRAACTTELECDDVWGGYWYDGECQAEEEEPAGTDPTCEYDASVCDVVGCYAYWPNNMWTGGTCADLYPLQFKIQGVQQVSSGAKIQQ